jgi:hypothetical protein
MLRRLTTFLALSLVCALASAGSAVLIDSGDGTGNTTAPSPDPGWSHVGLCNGLTAVYLGDGWVLTAHHVGACNLVLSGVTYPWLPGTAVRLSNEDATGADLVLFWLQAPHPPLGDLEISAATPANDTDVVMIGRGRNRGAATTWNPPGPGPTYDGYTWGLGYTIRWGTNFVEPVAGLPELEDYFQTRLFATTFDESGAGHSVHEAQAATGDSGGAVFASTGSGYELAGILLGITSYQDQPPETALYGNHTLAADLSFYRDEIVETMPEPSGALWPAAALVIALAGRARCGSAAAARTRTTRTARRARP